ncbi:Uncharacterised protein [Bordetella pertussis]|nr:Uncharacterised protein [Bordetella pertussis]
MLAQQRRQARQPAAGRIAADAGIDDAVVGGLLRNPLGQHRHPAGPAPQAVFGRQAVADHQDGVRCGTCGRGRGLSLGRQGGGERDGGKARCEQTENNAHG